jgi:hypothetical protein
MENAAKPLVLSLVILYEADVGFAGSANSVLIERRLRSIGDGEVQEGKRFSIFILCGSCALFSCLHAGKHTLQKLVL